MSLRARMSTRRSRLAVGAATGLVTALVGIGLPASASAAPAPAAAARSAAPGTAIIGEATPVASAHVSGPTYNYGTSTTVTPATGAQPFVMSPMTGPALGHFNWTLDVTSTRTGRQMQFGNGQYCLDYASTYVQWYTATPYISITLYKETSSGITSDTGEGTVNYTNDGIQRGYCWPKQDPYYTYHFQYNLPTSGYGYEVKAAGDVHG